MLLVLFTTLAQKDSGRIYTNAMYLIEMTINIPFLSQEYTLEKSVLFLDTLTLANSN